MASRQYVARVSVSAGIVFVLIGAVRGGVAVAQCPAPTVVATGARYLDVNPPSQHVDPVAIFVSQTPPLVWCSKYVDVAGRLVDQPVFQTPAVWGTVHVRGQALVPLATYKVQTDCGTPGSPILSTAVTGQLWKWGDTNRDGISDFVDVTNIVDAFRGVFHAFNRPCTSNAQCQNVAGSYHTTCDIAKGYCIRVTMENVDLYGASDSLPDRAVDFNDILSSVDGFQGWLYSEDCNGNRVYDGCDVASGFSQDCQPNEVPDECETDCQPNGIPDDCDISNATSQDCQPNGVPDECDPDCDEDGIPDTCDAWEDADDDGIGDCWDACDNNPPDRPCIGPELCLCYFPGSGIYIPDYPKWSCGLNGGTCLYWCRDGCLIGDFNLDGDVDLSDAGQMQICLTAWQSGCQRGDYEPDGDVDCEDWAKFKVVWTDPSPPPPWPPCP